MGLVTIGTGSVTEERKGVGLLLDSFFRYLLVPGTAASSKYSRSAARLRMLAKVAEYFPSSNDTEPDPEGISEFRELSDITP